MPKHQSAYREHYITETALMKVFNDLLTAADRGQISALCLLDLTAAFDTVDHNLLLRRLKLSYGVQGQALSWFESYLTNRTYCVIYSGETSSEIFVTCSVPQGSVLGSLLFVLYTDDLADIAMEYGVTLHAFADDTQLYLHCDSNSIVQSVTTLEQCITAIGKWMSANHLKLNTDKTELLWTGSRHCLRGLSGNGPSLVLGVDDSSRGKPKLAQK